MANVSRVRGFVPVRSLDGPYNAQTREMMILSAATITYHIGDVVRYSGTSGLLGKQISGRDCEGMPGILNSTQTTTADTIVGVIVGFISNEALPEKYNPANTDRIALVEVGRNTVFEVQEDGVGNNIAATAIGANIAQVSAAGSTVTGLSAYSIDSSTTATTLTYPWKLLGLVKRPDNAFGLSTTDLGKFEVVRNDPGFVGA